MSVSCLKKYFKDEGFAVVENFLTMRELIEMERAMERLRHNRFEEMNLYVEGRRNIDIDDEFQYSKRFLPEYNDKPNYYYEALRECGYPLLNKIGHFLHWTDPTFRRITYSQKMGALCDMLGLLNPIVIDSLVSYKRAGVGGIVNAHQDATYISTDPESVISFWFPMVPLSENNSCLWVVRKSHKNGLLRRFFRTNNLHPRADKMAYDRPPIDESIYSFDPVFAKPGDCIILNSLLVRKNGRNVSKDDRPAYCFRIAEKLTKFSPLNWIQARKGYPFVSIYDHCEKSFQEEPVPIPMQYEGTGSGDNCNSGTGSGSGSSSGSSNDADCESEAD